MVPVGIAAAIALVAGGAWFVVSSDSQDQDQDQVVASSDASTEITDATDPSAEATDEPSESTEPTEPRRADGHRAQRGREG